MNTSHEQRRRKYAIGKTLQTSNTRSWTHVLADQLQYPSSIWPPFEWSVTEVCIATQRDDAVSLALTARPVQSYAATGGRSLNPHATHHGLGEARLGRVLEFMRAHIEEDIGMDQLAAVACLSPFHFARMFRISMGVPPHRYLCSLRLERSKESLARSDTPLAEIALAACFSTQANFTRAFRTATGMTPGEFRRKAR
jgi:transcriptional regulator GlxA family with amidase domain